MKRGVASGERGAADRQAVAERAADDRGAAGAGAGGGGRQHRHRCGGLGPHRAARDRGVHGAADRRRDVRGPGRAVDVLAVSAQSGADRRARPRQHAHGRAGGAGELDRHAGGDRAEQRDHGRGAERDAAAGGIRAVPRLRADPDRARAARDADGILPGDRRRDDRDRALGAVGRAAGRVRADPCRMRALGPGHAQRARCVRAGRMPAVPRGDSDDAAAGGGVRRRTLASLRAGAHAGAGGGDQHAILAGLAAGDAGKRATAGSATRGRLPRWCCRWR